MTIYRGYDAVIDFLASAEHVLDAFVKDGRVSTYQAGDDEHLVVVTTPVRGKRLDVLVCQYGWLPLDMLPTADEETGVEPEPDADGHQFDYIVNPRRRAALSRRDFERISDAIRTHTAARQVLEKQRRQVGHRCRTDHETRWYEG